MAADLGTTTYSAVTWTAGDVITEAKLDAMVANDQAYDSHAAQGLLLNNAKAYCGKNAAGTARNLIEINAADEGILGPDFSGWNKEDDTWVYVSASTFKIVGKNVTAKFIAGTRLRFKQGGAYKYAVVVSSAFSTDTTVTIAVNTDYTVANAVITDNYYSYQSCPQGYPQWFAFTPAWANLTEGSATNVGAYSLIGKTLTFRTKIVFAANTSVSGGVTLTLPVTINTAYTTNCNIGIVSIADSGVGLILGKIWADGQIYADLSSGPYVVPIILSSTVPMTWTTGDVLEVVGSYQIA
jgi:hypothetical protein